MVLVLTHFLNHLIKLGVQKMSTLPLELVPRSPATMFTCKALYDAFNKYYKRPWVYEGRTLDALICVNALTGFELTVRKTTNKPSIKAFYQGKMHFFPFGFGIKSHSMSEWLSTRETFEGFANCIFDNMSLPNGRLAPVLQAFCDKHKERWCLVNGQIMTTWEVPEGIEPNHITVLQHITYLKGDLIKGLTAQQALSLNDEIAKSNDRDREHVEKKALLHLIPGVNKLNIGFYISKLNTSIRFTGDLKEHDYIDEPKYSLVLRVFKVNGAHFGYVLASPYSAQAPAISTCVLMIRLPDLENIDWEDACYPSEI